jgi:hypothetical protein
MSVIVVLVVLILKETFNLLAPGLGLVLSIHTIDMLAVKSHTHATQTRF